MFGIFKFAVGVVVFIAATEVTAKIYDSVAEAITPKPAKKEEAEDKK